MSLSSRGPLPVFDRNLLRTVEFIVPPTEREEWLRSWQAELWHLHHRTSNRRAQTMVVVTDLSIGIIRDACWLRSHSWRRALSGTATLCVGSLLGLSLLSMMFALLLDGSWHVLRPLLLAEFTRSLFAAPLIVFVSFATSARRHIEPRAGRSVYWLKRLAFFSVKILLLLLLAFLLSADVCTPLHATMPASADLLQILCFVIFSIVGLRWAFRDQEERCKHCLQSLQTPARVGRPSHNLLEWNGTELSCKRGHGLLSVPRLRPAGASPASGP